MVTAHDVSAAKPDPQPYLVAATRLGVSPRRCLVIEEAPAGVLADRRAGCLVLAVAGTHNLADLDAALRLPDLGQVRLITTSTGFGLARRADKPPG